MKKEDYEIMKDDRGTIRPPKPLIDFLKDYIDTKEAKDLGFTTPSSVVEFLLRNFAVKNKHVRPMSSLQEQNVYVEEHPDEIIIKTNSEEVRLIVQHIATGENVLICTKCTERDCIFRNYVLLTGKYSSFLKNHGLKIKRKRVEQNPRETQKMV